MQNWLKCIGVALLSALPSGLIMAGSIALSQTPLFVTDSVSPLTLIVMSKDHKLYYEAYNDASDLNGDGQVETHYTPSIDYYGYFDSYKCYTYNGTAGQFEPASTTTNKTCSGQWSGDFLNYLTTARMDALRKVLYGGTRHVDTTSSTVLERTYIPQDAHSFGKEYTSVAVDGYDIADYTPLSVPTGSNRHLFANTTLLSGGSGEPRLRVLLNQPYRVWEWLSIERPVANNRVIHGGSGPVVSPTDYFVRVKVCDSGVGLEGNCKLYGSVYKPIGLLQEFGESNSMYFGLLTGSFNKNLSGGVLRKKVSSINDEIDASTGQFTTTVGIIKTIDRLKIPNFGGSYTHQSSCGFIFDRAFNEGECRSWGNPIGEMLYEGVRYFSGKGSATSEFTYGGANGDDKNLGLPLASWDDPYVTYPRCAKPNFLIISDVSPSYDSDQLPGSYFSSFTGDVSGLDVSTLGDTIWNQEMGGAKSIFIGQSGATRDRAPSAKTVTSFGDIRGLAPEEPSKEGSYYTASVAYYARVNDLNSADDDQLATTYAIVFPSPIPDININVNGNTVRLVPFGKSVGGCFNASSFQPTNTIVDFYVTSLGATSGQFRVNFEDAEQGADHDMDAIVEYNYSVDTINNQVTITLNSVYAAGCVIQHMGYVISGTTEDGAYLEVRDLDTSAGSDPDYELDTPPGQPPGGTWNDGAALPTSTSRTFTVGTSTSELLKNPLWYATKWGHFTDSDDDKKPNLSSEWDSNNDGIPDTYFLVTQPQALATQLRSAMSDIIERSSSATSASINSATLNSETRIYQAIFNSADWSGKLLSFKINSDGSIDTSGSGPSGSEWDAGAVLTGQTPSQREIITYNPTSQKGIPWQWPANPGSPTSDELTSTQMSALDLNPVTVVSDGLAETRLTYLRGIQTSEVQNGGTFRNREVILGDIVHSRPLYVGAPRQRYPDNWGNGAAENSALYTDFKEAKQNRKKVIYTGANDGMLHAFDATTGEEILAYVPNALFPYLNQLTDPNYSHRYYVDGPAQSGDVFFNGSWHSVLVGTLGAGGQAVYALDITDPDNFSESSANNIVLWEFTDPDLGNSLSQPSIVRLHNGDWAAIFGSGFNNTDTDGNASTTGNAFLFIVNIETGQLIKKIDVEKGSADDPLGLSRANALATPAVVDINNDFIADYVYAGDLFGNLWKFDLTGSNANQWDVALKQGSTPKPLFIAQDSGGDRQPITSRPMVGRLDPSRASGYQIYFGTGKYVELNDKTNVDVQTFYGIEDREDGNTVSRNNLLEQEIVYETTVNELDYRVTSNDLKNSSHRGWYIDLIYNSHAEGERVVADPILRNDKIIFTTIIPSTDVCSFGGSGWLMELSAQDGNRLDYSPFDLNGDGLFSSSDFVNLNGTMVPVSGRKSEVGIIPAPGILSMGTKEMKYVPGSSGEIDVISENAGDSQQGRQSWRQLR